MKMIVGLGNPGTQYAKTRHNAGFMVVERLLSRHRVFEAPRARFHAACVEAPIGAERCLLMRPTTYMNRSGLAVAEALNFYKLKADEDLLVMTDDVALPTGMIRLRAAGSAGGHNGLSDIQRSLGHDNYPRLRIGVGVQPNGGKPPLMVQADFVLGRFVDEESDLLDQAIEQSCDAVETFVSRGVQAAMNRFNRANSPPQAPPPSGPPAT